MKTTGSGRYDADALCHEAGVRQYERPLRIPSREGCRGARFFWLRAPSLAARFSGARKSK